MNNEEALIAVKNTLPEYFNDKEILVCDLCKKPIERFEQSWGFDDRTRLGSHEVRRIFNGYTAFGFKCHGKMQVFIFFHEEFDGKYITDGWLPDIDNIGTAKGYE